MVLAYSQNVEQHAEKATPDSSTFGFCRRAKPKQKPKEPEFLPTLDRNRMRNKKS
jgi:hypothetical protein